MIDHEQYMKKVEQNLEERRNSKRFAFGQWCFDWRAEREINLRTFCKKYDLNSAEYSKLERGILAPSENPCVLVDMACRLFELEDQSEEFHAFMQRAYDAFTAIKDIVNTPIEEKEVPQGRGATSLRAFERAIPPRYELWALDVEGREPTSEELAEWLDGRMSRGVKGIAFILGGAEGLPEEIISRSDLRFSLSRLTLPHRLARLILAEQLYRAMTIIRGEPYHK